MRTVFALAVAIAALSPAAIPRAVEAQQLQRDTTIVVSITRSGRAPADRVSLYFGVEGIGETPAAAIERLQARLKNMQDSTKRISPSAQVDVPVMLGVGPNVRTDIRHRKRRCRSHEGPFA